VKVVVPMALVFCDKLIVWTEVSPIWMSIGGLSGVAKPPNRHLIVHDLDCYE